MNKNNNNSIRESINEHVDEFMRQLAEDPLLGKLASPADMIAYLQDGITRLLNVALLKERELYLEQNPTDRANGFAPTRQFYVKTLPICIDRPRTRGNFYPACLPKYQRHIPQSYQELLEQILLEARSFDSALRTLQTMGLGYSCKELEALLSELEAEANAFHNRPLDADWLVIYIDAKELDLKDEHYQVKKATHFIITGINFEGKKQVLCAKLFWGDESIDCWRQVFIELKNRGVCRILLIITDDFPGIRKLISSFWNNTDHQLCTVHLLRNAKHQLSPDDYHTFLNSWNELINSSSFESALSKWTDLLKKLNNNYPSWTNHLKERTNNYLAFMRYPSSLRKHIKSTNLPEGINSLIETLRHNSGGHFHTQRELYIKMKILIDRLHNKKWNKPHPMFLYHRPSLIRMFKQRFESELPNNHPLTQFF